MIKYIRKIRSAFLLMIVFTLLTGVIYPAIVTGLSQLLFPWRANGSLITQNEKMIGSELIGQFFTEPGYFWGRPSSTLPYAYNAASSAGSNFGPSNPNYLALVDQRAKALRHANPHASFWVPADLVTASGSGLDPEISLLAAYYQSYRIAKARHISETQLNTLIRNMASSYSLGILGEPRVNVLQLNLALDTLTPHKR